ncbi:MAG: YihY/virulence factor BrkB family protein [Spirosomaceae bacterium]|nr:YihY/virulence factor BrkB family protein [Spirosomataceae bacterium]
MIDVANLKAVKAAENFLRKTYFFNTTVSLYLVLSILWKKIITLDIDQRAAAVSFSFMLAVFPGIIFLFTLIPFIPIDNLDGRIMDYLREIFPRRIYSTVASTIQEIVSRKRSGILSFGFLFTIFASTNGMMALMRAFNIVLNEKEKRNFFKARFLSLTLTVLLVMLLVSAVVILIVGNLLINFLFENGVLDENVLYYLLEIVRYLSIFFIFSLGIGVIYYFGPAVQKRIPLISAGSIFASIMCILITNAFSFYLVNFASYNRLYGSIGTFIGLMVWIYLISLIIILGFEVNISVRDAVEKEALKLEDSKK